MTCAARFQGLRRIAPRRPSQPSAAVYSEGPCILTGMEVGIVLAIIGAIVGEFIGAQSRCAAGSCRGMNPPGGCIVGLTISALEGGLSSLSQERCSAPLKTGSRSKEGTRAQLSARTSEFTFASRVWARAAIHSASVRAASCREMMFASAAVLAQPA